MGLAEDKGSESIDPNGSECSESISTESGSNRKVLKSCIDCHTTKTPLWRSGPSGPKSLCNACGIRYTKRRREEEDPEGEKEMKKKRLEKRRADRMDVELKLQILGKLGYTNDLFLKKRSTSSSCSSGSSTSWLQKKLGEEEEQAAVLLMALSCGFR